MLRNSEDILDDCFYETTKLLEIRKLVSQIKFKCLDKDFRILVELDKIYSKRVYIQVSYVSTCTKSGNSEEWKGRKYYLSEFMTDDEVIKTCYVACESAVKHEIMEGFTVNNIVLFNPHVDYKELLKISNKEIKRK